MVEVYQKRIVPYLDGTLSMEERAEFEAYLMTHPEFEGQVKKKQREISELLALMPKVSLSNEARESLESEIKLSLSHLLKEEPKSFWGGIKNNIEDWFNR